MPDRHEYELYLAIENIDHTSNQGRSPQTTDVIDKCFLAGSGLFSSRAWVIAAKSRARGASSAAQPSSSGKTW
jgi:hypothetical protein